MQTIHPYITNLVTGVASAVPEQITERLSTFGVAAEGTFRHNYPDTFRLVPWGHLNWKWNETRRKYHSWEQERLAAVLTLASQQRIVANLPIVWFTDNEALKSFLDKEPPLNARLRRAYLFLSQFALQTFHLPGLKNELCDFLSRNAFQELVDVDFKSLAREAVNAWTHKLIFGCMRVCRSLRR